MSDKTKIILWILFGLVLALVIGGLVWYFYGLAAGSVTGTSVASGAGMAIKKKSDEIVEENKKKEMLKEVIARTISPSSQQPNELRGEVVRRIERDGPGVFRLKRGEELLGEWECITGGKELNSKNYGGLTPELKWVMIEDIAWRKHPSRDSKMEFCRIIPVGSKEGFERRTFDVDRWPFMIHISGRSTGCIAIKSKDWKEAVKILNENWKRENFIIEVKNED